MLRWSRWVIAAGLKLIVIPLGCGVASLADRELGFPRQQSQSGSLPPAPVEVGRFDAGGAPKRRWQQRRFCPRPPNPKGGTALQGRGMATPKEMDVVRPRDATPAMIESYRQRQASR